jgi:uncharacterized membrane protein
MLPTFFCENQYQYRNYSSNKIVGIAGLILAVAALSMEISHPLLQKSQLSSHTTLASPDPWVDEFKAISK